MEPLLRECVLLAAARPEAGAPEQALGLVGSEPTVVDRQRRHGLHIGTTGWVPDRPRARSRDSLAGWVYMPIAWYPLSTYSVVPVTLRAVSLSRYAAAPAASSASAWRSSGARRVAIGS